MNPQQPYQQPGQQQPPVTPPPYQGQPSAYPTPQPAPPTYAQPQPYPQAQTPPPPLPGQPVYQPPVAAIDYLQEISSPPPKKTDMKFLYIVFGGLGAAVLLFFGIMMFSSANSGPTDTSRLQSLYFRLTSLQKVAQEQSKNLRSSDIRRMNASYSTYIDNSLYNLEQSFAKGGVILKGDKLPKTYEAEEKKYVETLNQKYSDALLNIDLDRVYARSMSAEIGAFRAKMVTAYKITGNKDIRDTLEKTDNNFEPIAKQFANFSESTGNINKSLDGN